MKTERIASNARLLSILAVMLSTACAGGGGASGGSSTFTPSPAPPSSNASASPCGILYGQPVQCVPLRPQFPAGGGSDGSGPSFTLADLIPKNTAPPPGTFMAQDHWYSDGELLRIEKHPVEMGKSIDSLEWRNLWGGGSTLAKIGHPEISAGWDGSDTNRRTPNPFVAFGAGNVLLSAAYQYQSFGVWNEHDTYYAMVVPWSYGEHTPASAVPTTGNATFNGKLIGLYVSPAAEGAIAAADLRVEANFSTRSLNLNSTGTTLTRDFMAGVAAPNLNLSGTLTYSSRENTFAGTLTSSGGTLSGSSTGRFYGPAAQELGGIFSLTSSTREAFMGSYAGKR